MICDAGSWLPSPDAAIRNASGVPLETMTGPLSAATLHAWTLAAISTGSPTADIGGPGTAGDARQLHGSCPWRAAATLVLLMDLNLPAAADTAWENLYAASGDKFTDMVAAWIWWIEMERASGARSEASWYGAGAVPLPEEAGRGGAPAPPCRLCRCLTSARKAPADALAADPPAPGRPGYGTRPPDVRRTHAAREQRRLLRAAGGSPLYVPAAPARAYIEWLQEQQMTVRQIAAAAGLGTSVLYAILGGKDRIRTATAAALFRVTPDTRPAVGRVPATGTVRRLRALMLGGWPARILARELGYRTQSLRRLVTDGQPLTPAGTATAVEALYDRLWDKPGPSAKTRQLAAQRGWAPALAWDDKTIDDPAAVPQGIRPLHGSRVPEVLEDADELIAQDLTVAQVAARLGISPASLSQARSRRRLARQTPSTSAASLSAAQPPVELAGRGAA